MTNPAQHHKPASQKQLAFLRRLAAERGQSFAYPQTSAEASEEITRLKGEWKTSHGDRRREDKLVRQAMAGRGDACRVREDELSGYASTASWSREVQDDEEDKGYPALPSGRLGLRIVARLRRASRSAIADPTGVGQDKEETMSTILLRRRRPTEAERAERREKERALMAEAVEQLESSEGWKRWLRVRRYFHTYSLHNQLLIALQMPEATRVAGFHAWLKLGYAVRKGELAIYIWAPCRPSKKKMREWREAGSDPESEPRVYFRMVAVFDRSQVAPLPDFPGGPVALDPPIAPIDGDGLASLFEPLSGLAASIGVAVTIGDVPAGAGGCYRPARKEIGLQPISPEISPNQQVKTLIHELAHALVNVDRRDEDPKLTYAEEEVVVECVAFTVCSGVGFDASGFSVPYVASWSAGSEIERHAALIDRLARRLEEVTSVDAGSVETEDAEDQSSDPQRSSGTAAGDRR